MTSSFFATRFQTSIIIIGLLFLPRGAEAEVYFSLSSHSYSKAAPVKQFFNALEGPPMQSGEYAFTHNQVEVGGKWRNFGMSTFRRYDYFLQFNDDTAYLAYVDKNDLPVETGRTYDIYLQANHILSSGVSFSYQLDIAPEWQADVRLNYLQAKDMTDGILQGQIKAGSNSYAGDLTLDYGYSEDHLLERDIEDIQGRGYSLDVDIEWQAADNLLVKLEGRDIFSRIYWKDLTYTTASATTDTISYDSNGALDSVPGISGIESYRNQTQRLPARYRLSTIYQITNHIKVAPGVFAYDKYLFPRLGLIWEQADWVIQGRYDFGSEAFGLQIGNNWFHLALEMDDTDWEDAHTLGLSFGLNIAF